MLLRRDKLVARDHAARQDLDIGRSRSRGVDDGLNHVLVCREGQGIQARDLPRLVTQGRHVKVVHHAVGRHHQVTHVKPGIQRTGNTGVDHAVDAKAIGQNLHAHAGVDLANATLHDNDLLAA